MKLIIATRRPTLRIDKNRIERLTRMIEACARPFARRNACAVHDAVTLVLTGDDGIASVNQHALGHDGPTDVITLAYEATPATPATAEIVVNVQRAVDCARNNPRPGWTPSHELALYLAHGFDHLAGHTDATPQDRRRMRRREYGWIRRAQPHGLVEQLIQSKEVPNE